MKGSKQDRRLIIALMIVLGIGMLISTFLVYEHYVETEGTFCKFGENFDCGIVNKSPYANVDGIFYLMAIDWGWNVPMLNIPIPVAGIGFVILGLTLYLTLSLYNGWKVPKLTQKNTIYTLRGIMIASVLFGGYLFLIQKFVLQTWCIYCLSLDTTLVAALVLSFLIRGKK